MTAVILLIVIGVGIIFYAIAQYNGLVALRRQTGNAFAQIDVQLKRRYDLIPNLVETVKGYMKHEQETLERVIQARNRALSAGTVAEKADAENQLTRAVNGIFALSEAYPELRSNENMLSLQEELKSTENKIAFARQYYNDIVTRYNTALETFPSSIFANSAGMKPKDLFEIDDATHRENVKVSF
ncbi:MAG TPA: LemA family protein [Fimbriimonas sp.]|nr:LemA family protein [Fimbriimonas sp.]